MITAVPVLRVPLAFVIALGATILFAEAGSIRGYWVGPGGAVIRIASCTSGLCIQLVGLPRSPHPQTDVRNPDPRARGRPLCGLIIGEGFVARDARHAEGGRLYDPRVGRTYRAAMTAEDGKLELRGYLGVKLFGRTETWKRTGPRSVSCH